LNNNVDKKESRRSFLKNISMWTVFAAFTTQAFIYIRSLFPNVLYEKPRRYKVGMPDQYSSGVTLLEKNRVFIFRNDNNFHAISAVCTHLGCTVKYSQLRQPQTIVIDGKQQTVQSEFHCPCHGSKFYENGKNFEGPAPTPLQWYEVSISPDDGQLVVDVSKEVNQDFRLII